MRHLHEIILAVWMQWMYDENVGCFYGIRMDVYGNGCGRLFGRAKSAGLCCVMPAEGRIGRVGKRKRKMPDEKMTDGLKLSKIKLAGFKSYGDAQEIDIRDINILIGPNGAGKSNLISFLEMISFLSTGAFRNYVAKNGFARSILHHGKGIDEKISGSLFFCDGKTEDGYDVSIKTSFGGGLYIDEEAISYKAPGHDKPYQKKLNASGEESGLSQAAEYDPSAKVILSLLQSSTIYHFNDTTVNARVRSSGYLYDNAYFRSDAGNLAAFLYRLKLTDQYKKYYNRIVRMIREVFPRFEEFVLEPSVIEGADEKIRLNWIEKGSEVFFGPHMMSDGTLRFVSLATLLLQPPDLIPGVIILDEPELGLHPYAIRVLCKMIHMASSHTRLIVATQSSQLINEFECEDILVTEYDSFRKSSIIHRLSETELDIWLQDYSLSELWEKNVLGGNPGQ